MSNANEVADTATPLHCYSCYTALRLARFGDELRNMQIALHRRLTGVATSDQHSCVGERYEEDATMDAFDHILHWKLTHGSHPFPGKDGGT